MEYLCLVYAEEARLNAMSQGEIDGLVNESLANDEELRKSGHPILAQALEHVEAATTVRVRNGKLFGDGRSVHRDERAVRRIRVHRSQGPERGDPDRRADPVGAHWKHRVAPGDRPPRAGPLGSVSDGVAAEMRERIDLLYRSESRRSWRP